jgi:WD40 repeat protein
VTALVFSPDSRLLVSGSEDGAVRLWNPTIRTLRGTLLTPASVVDIVFSPDGQLLAASSLDMVVRIWSVKNRALLHTLSGAESGVIKYLAFAPDGKSPAFGSSGRPLSLWDVTTGALLSSFEHDARSVSSLAMSPDGKLLACAMRDRSIDVRKVGEGSLLHTFVGHMSAATKLAFSLDSHLLYSRGGSTTKVWDLNTGALRCTMGSPDMAALHPVLSPDGQLMATTQTDGIVYFWDAQDGQQVGLFSGHSDAVREVIFSHDGQLLASASSDGTVRIWEVRRNARDDTSTQFKVDRLHLTLDGTILAVTKSHLTVPKPFTDFWHVATQALQRTLDGSYVSSLSSGGAMLIATATTGGRVALSNESTSAIFDISRYPGYIASFVALSPNGQYLTVLFNGGLALLFDAATRTLRHEFRADGWSTAFSPDSRILASCWADDVAIRDAKTAVEIRKLEGHSEDTRAVSFSPSGHTLASTDVYTIRLWNCKTWRTVRILSIRDKLYSLAFSADSSRLITD